MSETRQPFWRRPQGQLLAQSLAAGSLVIYIGLGLVLVAFEAQSNWLGQFTGLVEAATAVLIFAGLAVYVTYVGGLQPQPSKPTLDSRIDSVSRSMTGAAGLVAEIEAELRARQAVIDQMRAESKRLEEMAQVNRDAAQAIAKVVEGAVRRRATVDRILNLVVGAVVGVATTLLGVYLSSGRGH